MANPADQLGRLIRVNTSVSPGLRPLINDINNALREMDRRRSISTPDVVNDESARPSADLNEGRMIYVGGSTQEFQFSDGSVWNSIFTGGGGGTAPVNATYITITNDSTLTDERSLAVTSPITKSDAGANSAITLALDTAALGGTPALVLGTTQVEGGASTFITTDSTIALFDATTPAELAATAVHGSTAFAADAAHVHEWPTTLQSAANSKTLILTDDGSDMTLAWNLGILKFEDPASNGVQIERRLGIGSAPTSAQTLLVNEFLPQTSAFGYSLRFIATSNDSSNIGTATIIGCAGSAINVSGRSAKTRFIGTDTTVRINGTGYAPTSGNRGFRSILQFSGDDSSTILPYHRHFSNQTVQDNGTAVITDHVAFYADTIGQGTNRFSFYAVTDPSLFTAIGCAIVAKTGAYTLTDADHTVTCDTSGGAFTITLPALSGRLGRIYNVKNDGSSTNVITLDGDGSNIDGSPTATFSTLYMNLQVQGGASEWHIL